MMGHQAFVPAARAVAEYHRRLLFSAVRRIPQRAA